MQMHPSEDLLLLHDGFVCYIWKIEIGNSVASLFEGTKNTSYYFVRFCFSMDKLAFDPEILARIPMLLQKKLPIFEVE